MFCVRFITRPAADACTGAGFLPRDVLRLYLQLLGPARVQLRCLDEHLWLRVQWMFCVRFITRPAADACTGARFLPRDVLRLYLRLLVGPA